MIRFTLLALPIMIAIIACATTWPAHAERTLVHETVVAAPVAEVWNAFTTSEGFASWAVAHAEIDLRIGGDMRTHYKPEGVLGDEGTIINRIISFEPERMLSIQNVQAPKAFKNAELFQQTWTVISFEPVAPDRTHVRCVGLGFGEGSEWDEVYTKFKAGNAHTLEKLRQKFEPAAAPDDPQRVMALLGKLAGGEWIHEESPPGAPQGSVFRVRNVVQRGPDGSSLTMRGWLGDGAGMHEHAASMVWLEPGAHGSAGEVRFQNISETSAIARGSIRLIGENSVEWDWNETGADGVAHRVRITMSFTADDRYKLKIDQIADDGAATPLVQAEFTRVARAPAVFLKMRAK
jgi:uncharacterized protein YndB with AHSA1/START domain